MALQDHEEVMLRKNSTSRTSGTPSGNTVALLSPNFEVVSAGKNKLFAAPRAGDRGSIVRDNRLIMHEVTVQGAFLDAAPGQLPQAQIDALEAIFQPDPGEIVTAAMQVRRVWDFFQRTGGAFELYDKEDEYRATVSGEEHYRDVYPPVTFDEVRPQFRSGRNNRIWVLKFQVGVVS